MATRSSCVTTTSPGEPGGGVDEEVGELAVALLRGVQPVGGEAGGVVVDDRGPVGDRVDAVGRLEDLDLVGVAIVAAVHGREPGDLLSAPRPEVAHQRGH